MGPGEPSYRRTHTVPLNYSGIAFGPDGDADPCPLSPDVRRGEGDAISEERPAASVSTVEAPTPGEDTSPRAVSAASANGVSPASDRGDSLWGHGIGYEELLLLGLMVFLMNECDGEGDFKETLILLGLLLLGG